MEVAIKEGVAGSAWLIVWLTIVVSHALSLAGSRERQVFLCMIDTVHLNFHKVVIHTIDHQNDSYPACHRRRLR